MPSQSDLSPYHGIALGGEANNYGLSEDFEIENESLTRSQIIESHHKRSRSSDIQLLFGGANNISVTGTKESEIYKDKNQLCNDFNKMSLSASAASPAIADLNLPHSVEPNDIFSGNSTNMNSNNNFFSLTEDDEDINISDDIHTSNTPTKENTDTIHRRHSSSGSKGGESSRSE